MNGHGGARRGAGRPIKWGIDCVVAVGQACEENWRQAVALATKSALERRHIFNSELQYLWSEASLIPFHMRRRWIESHKGQIHVSDFGEELRTLEGTPCDGEPSGFVRITARPPRGTRKRIIAKVAEQFCVPEAAVDNLWQAYRRFEREIRESPDSGNT